MLTWMRQPIDETTSHYHSDLFMNELIPESYKTGWLTYKTRVVNLVEQASLVAVVFSYLIGSWTR